MGEAEYLAVLAGLHRARWPADLPSEPQYPFGEVALTEYLRRWAEIQPDKAAVIFHGFRLTYGELDRLSERFAALLLSRGIRRGDRIAVFLPNCPQYFIAFYGIMKLGIADSRRFLTIRVSRSTPRHRDAARQAPTVRDNSGLQRGVRHRMPGVFGAQGKPTIRCPLK